MFTKNYFRCNLETENDIIPFGLTDSITEAEKWADETLRLNNRTDLKVVIWFCGEYGEKVAPIKTITYINGSIKKENFKFNKEDNGKSNGTLNDVSDYLANDFEPRPDKTYIYNK